MKTFSKLYESIQGKVIGSVGELLKNNKEFIIFGASLGGKITLKYLRSKGAEALFFCDNDPQKHGLQIEGLEVMPPDAFSKYPHIPVAIGSTYARDIAQQIQAMSNST